MKNLLLYFILPAFVFLSCNDNATQSVVIDNKYAMEIPSSMNKVQNLNDDASLQYMNGLNELYIIVIDEPKEDINTAIDEAGLNDVYSKDLKGYARLLQDGLDEVAKVKSKSDLKLVNINSLNAMLTEVEAVIDGLDIYYHFAYIAGKERYYQIMTWTLLDRKEKHREKMEKMIHSFKEL